MAEFIREFIHVTIFTNPIFGQKAEICITNRYPKKILYGWNFCDHVIHECSVTNKNALLHGPIRTRGDFKAPIWVVLPYMLLIRALVLPFIILRTAIKLLVGLLVIPFNILRMTIKFILLAPKLYILRGEDHLRKHVPHEEMLDDLSRTILSHYIDLFVKNTISSHLSHLNQPKEMLEVNFEKFVNQNYLPKYPFGPGYFIYIGMYHLTFVAAFASVPLLLYKFDKLPSIIPHVPTLYLSLGLVALLTIPFFALNIRQCLKINCEIKYFQNCYYVKAEEKEYEKFEEVVRDQAHGVVQKLHDDLDALKKEALRNGQYNNDELEALFQTTRRPLYDKLVSEKLNLCGQFTETTRRALSVPSTRYALYYGDNRKLHDLNGRPSFMAYDCTTDIGLGIGAILTAPRLSNPFNPEARDASA